MPSHHPPVTQPDTGTTGTTGTNTDSPAARRRPAPRPTPAAVPVVPVVPIAGVLPPVLRRPPPNPGHDPPSRSSTRTAEPTPDDDLEPLDPSSIPRCPRCNDLCDLQTLDAAWHCTRCRPAETDAIRRTTRRLLHHVRRLRRDATES